MSRRTWAGLLAVALVLVMSWLAWRQPVPYVTFSPGPTVDVLGRTGEETGGQAGDQAGEDIISVSGRTTYEPDGALRLTTVVPTGPEAKVSLPELVTAWADPDRSVYPFEAIYPEEATQKSVRQQSNLQMVSSQDNAVAAALNQLGIPFTEVVEVVEVTEDGPADGKLERGDVIVSVDGKEVSTLEEVTGAVRPLPVGSRVTVEVRRDGRTLEETLTTTASPQDPDSSALLVSIAPGYEFPFDVELNLDENIGGPSAGLVFALGIYDVLTPGSLTGGKVVAGTGEIDPQGRVSPIGGIQQKLVGAEDDGAELFLVPAANCRAALEAGIDPDQMRLVKVETLDQAIEDVRTWVRDPDAELTRCTR